MMNIRITFENLDGVTSGEMRKMRINPGYEQVNVYMILDINMDGKFTRKSRLVAEGHTSSPLSPMFHRHLG